MKTITGAIVGLSIVLGYSLATAMPPGFPPFMDDQELRELSSEAVSLALIHDLALTPEQREEMKQILKPIRGEFDLMRKAERKFRDEHIKPRLRQIISDLKAGRDPAPCKAEEAADMEAFRSQMAGLFVRADQAYGKIRDLLGPEQQSRLEDFRFQEYMGPTHMMHAGKLLSMEPMKLIQEIHGYSQEEIDRLVREITRREEAHERFESEEEREGLRDEKVQMLIDLIKRIHAMPQSEFDEKAELLKQEMKALSPGSVGAGRDRRHGRRRPSPFGQRGFDTRRIVLSASFYESL